LPFFVGWLPVTITRSACPRAPAHADHKNASGGEPAENEDLAYLPNSGHFFGKRASAFDNFAGKNDN
jgi:hypothetical protein